MKKKRIFVGLVSVLALILLGLAIDAILVPTFIFRYNSFVHPARVVSFEKSEMTEIVYKAAVISGYACGYNETKEFVYCWEEDAWKASVYVPARSQRFD